MSESVEQAALRRAAQDGIPEPWSGVLLTLESLARSLDGTFNLITLVRERHDEEIESLHAENAELRDGLLALTNRIEGLTRAFHSRTDHLA